MMPVDDNSQFMEEDVPEVIAPDVPIEPEEEVEVVVEGGVKVPPPPAPFDPNRKDHSAVEDEVVDPKVKHRFAQLTFERENAKRDAAHKAGEMERMRAERDAAIEMGRALAIRVKAQSTDNHTTAGYAINIAKEKAKNDMASAEAELREAQANGDATRVVEATKKMTRAQAEAMRIEDVSLPEAPADPDEIRQYLELQQYIQQQAKQPAAPTISPEQQSEYQQWTASNPWYTPSARAQPGTPQHTIALLTETISGNLEKEGRPFGTAEHFAELNRRLISLQGRQDDQQPVVQPRQTQAATQQAPTPPAVRRTSSSPAVAPIGLSRGGGRTTISISAEEASVAKAFGMTPKEYYEFKKGPNV
jgi:hypothetical protein